MLRVSSNESEPKRRVRFPGICAAARELGVTREHLYRVLSGQRVSHSLLRRYHQLKKRARRQKPPAQNPSPKPMP